MRHRYLGPCLGALLLAGIAWGVGASEVPPAGTSTTSPSGGSTPAEAPPWPASMAGVPDSVRPLLHVTTSHLPHFPGEDPNALDPASWPPSMQDSTHRCVLQLRTYLRGTPYELKDVRSRKPNQSLSARYLCTARGWSEPHYMGPFYVWDRNNAMVERSYRATDGRRYQEELYQYRSNGLLWAYRHRERNEDQSGPLYVLDEYYDPDGKLAGFSVERSAPDSLMTLWWRGEAVDAATFQKWAGAFK